MSKFLSGVVLGAVIGMLLAPEKGAKSRAVLQSRMDEFLKNPDKTVEKVKKDINYKVEDMKDNLRGEVEEKIGEVRETVADKIAPETNTKKPKSKK